MTSEEFEEISHECGYNTVRDSRVTICQAPESEFWLAVYGQGMVGVNQEFIFSNYVTGYIMPVNYKVYKLGMRKKVYRNYLLRMKRKYKNVKIELKKYCIEKDF
jgi:cell division protein YceG involved in septum cleavage